jgi:hypothetical protein
LRGARVCRARVAACASPAACVCRRAGATSHTHAPSANRT